MRARLHVCGLVDGGDVSEGVGLVHGVGGRGLQRTQLAEVVHLTREAGYLVRIRLKGRRKKGSISFDSKFKLDSVTKSDRIFAVQIEPPFHLNNIL